MSRVQFWKKFILQKAIKIRSFLDFPKKSPGYKTAFYVSRVTILENPVSFLAMAKLRINSDSSAVQKLQTVKKFVNTLDFQYLFAKKSSKFSVSESMRKYMIDFNFPVVVFRKKNKLKKLVQKVR